MLRGCPRDVITVVAEYVHNVCIQYACAYVLVRGPTDSGRGSSRAESSAVSHAAASLVAALVASAAAARAHPPPPRHTGARECCAPSRLRRPLRACCSAPAHTLPRSRIQEAGARWATTRAATACPPCRGRWSRRPVQPDRLARPAARPRPHTPAHRPPAAGCPAARARSSPGGLEAGRTR
ncbi:hypothetical protein T492DRAFT_964216 [Pavlovales sp. CCMP2436]|nr:hypothetical protein T492DRAFT_964216 [Pavlovales sp. CCMP2436]